MVLFFRIICLFSLFFGPVAAQAQNHFYTAKNINILIESSNLTTARDEALVKAQRLALQGFVSGITAEQAEKLKNINDAALSRATKDFSLQNERLGAGSYEALFTIRFDGVKLDNLLGGYGFSTPATATIDMTGMTEATASDPATAVTDGNDPAQPVAAAPTKPAIILLPVLDIGSRRVVWDEPNPWRDSWQKKHSPFSAKYSLIVPLGDVTDITDIPDGAFLSDKNAALANDHVQHMLERYGAEKLYVLVARSQGAALNPTTGLEIKAYSHDGKTLKTLPTMNSTARPGYLFEDAVDFTMQHIDAVADGSYGRDTVATTPVAIPTPPPQAAPVASIYGQPPAAAGGLVARIAIPNLSAWVGVQQKIRRVESVTNIATQEITPQNVTVRIESRQPVGILISQLRAAGFQLIPQSDGTFSLAVIN